jgi:predicted TIM-barrel fold metal-dependent hydrolase
MHLHAHLLADYGGGGRVCTSDQSIEFPPVDPRQAITLDRVLSCAKPLSSAPNDDAVMRESLAILEKRNIFAVTSGSLEVVTRWRAASPTRVIPAVSFARGQVTADELRRQVTTGQVAVFAEIGAQYRGLSLADERFEPYSALAEELDVPVGVHLGEGPPGGPHVGGSTYRAERGDPLQLEPVLIRHPKLRLYVMHYGSPFVDAMIALIYSHPQVYVDVAQNDWAFPRVHFYA